MLNSIRNKKIQTKTDGIYVHPFVTRIKNLTMLTTIEKCGTTYFREKFNKYYRYKQILQI